MTFPPLQDSLSVLAFIVSIVGIWLAIWEAMRNHRAIVDLIEVRATRTSNVRENAGSPYQRFQIVFRNVGIPIKKVSCYLLFEIGRDTYEIEIGTLPEDDEIGKGYVFEFQIKEYELMRIKNGEHLLKMFAKLSDLALQRARIDVRSQGYSVQQFRFWGIKQWLRSARPRARKIKHALIAAYLRFQLWGMPADEHQAYLEAKSIKWKLQCIEHRGRVIVMSWINQQSIDQAIKYFCSEIRNGLNSAPPNDAG